MKSLLLLLTAPLFLCHELNGDSSNKGIANGKGHVKDSSFVTVSGTQFYRDGKPYYIKGANYWQGMNLASLQGGDRDRMERELDQMHEIGVNNLRVMASSEGPDDQPYRMRPSLQPNPGQYNEQIFQGLDYLLDAMGKRNMTAVMTLNNFWHWSGGFSQYISWITNETIPYPVTDWDTFTNFARRFYTDKKLAKQTNKLYKNHIRAVQNRKNSFNGKVYKNDPVIMSWQIANEPQSGPASWFNEISRFIKQGAPEQLVSAGLESRLDHTDFLDAHRSRYVDYCTGHLWVENRGEYNASDPNSLEHAQEYGRAFISNISEWAIDIKKPILLEEFGMARDAWRNPQDAEYKYLPSTPTTHKDAFYKGLYDQILQLPIFRGSNFWAYGGLGRSTYQPNEYNMTWLGDPPHEPKGWYSVYNNDTTMGVIKDYFDSVKI